MPQYERQEEKPFTGEDETLSCVDCAQPFVFTAGEQDFYNSKGFVDRPKRCKACRAIRKAKKDQTSAHAEAAPVTESYQTWNEPKNGGEVSGNKRRRRRE